MSSTTTTERDRFDDVFDRVQERWDRKYPGLKLVHYFGKKDDMYVIGWKLIGLEVASGKLLSISKDEIGGGRYIAVEPLTYRIELLEKEFEAWAIDRVLREYRL